MTRIERLFIDLIDGELGPEGWRELQDILHSDPARRAELEDVAWAWYLLSNTPPSSVDVSPPHPEELIRRAEITPLRPDRAPADVPPGRSRRFPVRRAGLVAASVILAVSYGLFRWYGTAPEPGPFETPMKVSTVSTAQLADGTVVRLAPNAEMRVQAASGREVWLEGRALFEAAREDGETFRVRTEAGDVTVLGTRFDLDVDGSALRLIVLEGRVRYDGPAGNVVLDAEQMLESAGGASYSVVTLPDARARSEWAGDLLVFREAPLAEVAAELETTYGVEVRLASALSSRTISAWFVDRPLSEVLRVICDAALAACDAGDGIVTIEADRGWGGQNEDQTDGDT